MYQFVLGSGLEVPHLEERPRFRKKQETEKEISFQTNCQVFRSENLSLSIRFFYDFPGPLNLPPSYSEGRCPEGLRLRCFMPLKLANRRDTLRN